MTTAESTTPSAGQPATHQVAGSETTNLQYHQRIFHGFIKFMTWSAIVSILVLIFVALVNA